MRDADRSIKTVMQVEKTSLALGSVIDGRFKLLEVLENRLMGHGGVLYAETSSVQELKSNDSASVPVPGFTDQTYLSAGSYAKAYKAQRLDGTTVVLKVMLNPDKVRDQKACSAECSSMQQLLEDASIDVTGSSRILPCLENHIYDSSNPQIRYIVIPFGGVPLDKDKNLHPAVAAKQMLQGVRFLASKGMSHRDIKPDNVLVKYVPRHAGDTAPQPIITLIDFGLASYDVLCRTPLSSHGCNLDFSNYPYAPPEFRYYGETRGNKKYPLLTQLNPLPSTDSYDVWSVGYTVLELECKYQLTKELAFSGVPGIGDARKTTLCTTWAASCGSDLCAKGNFMDYFAEVVLSSVRLYSNRASAAELVHKMRYMPTSRVDPGTGFAVKDEDTV
jgi:hypothetical protein